MDERRRKETSGTAGEKALDEKDKYEMETEARSFSKSALSIAIGLIEQSFIEGYEIGFQKGKQNGKTKRV